MIIVDPSGFAENLKTNPPQYLTLPGGDSLRRVQLPGFFNALAAAPPPSSFLQPALATHWHLWLLILSLTTQTPTIDANWAPMAKEDSVTLSLFVHVKKYQICKETNPAAHLT